MTTHFDAFDPRYGRIGRHGAALIVHGGLKYPRGDYRRENAEAILADCPELVHVDVNDLCSCVADECVCTRDYTPTPEEERNDDMSDNHGPTDAEIDAAHTRLDARDGKAHDHEGAHARMVAEVHNAWRGENTSARADHDEDDRADASDDEAEQARARMIAENHGERGRRAPRFDAAHTSRAPASGAPVGLQRHDPRYPAATVTRAGDGTLRIDMGHIGSGSGL